MIHAAALAAVVCFAAGLRLFRLLPVAAGAIETGRMAARVMRDAGVSDREKEVAVRRSALRMLRAFLSIAARGAAAVAPALALLLVFDTAGLAPLPSVMLVFTSWSGIAVGSLVMGLALLGGTRQ